MDKVRQVIQKRRGANSPKRTRERSPRSASPRICAHDEETPPEKSKFKAKSSVFVSPNDDAECTPLVNGTSLNSEKSVANPADIWKHNLPVPSSTPSVCHAPVCELSDLPAALKDHCWILSGFRVPGYRPSQCFASMFLCHNETCNIWTHLIPCIVMLSLAWWEGMHNPAYVGDRSSDRYYFVMYCLFAMLVFLFSVIFHTFQCMSAESFFKLAKLDYMGILFQITGSLISAIHFCLDCYPRSRLVYAVIFIILIALTLPLMFSREFAGPRFSTWRAAIFVLLASFSVIPMIHIAVGNYALFQLHGWYLAAISSTYLCGVAVYTLHIPEYYFPRTFDFVGASHQLWHLFVASAVFLHYDALRTWRVWVLENPCSSPVHGFTE